MWAASWGREFIRWSQQKRLGQPPNALGAFLVASICRYGWNGGVCTASKCLIYVSLTILSNGMPPAVACMSINFVDITTSRH